VGLKDMADANLRKAKRFNNLVSYGTVYVVYRPRPLREAVIVGEELRGIYSSFKQAVDECYLDPTFYVIMRELNE